MDHKSPVLIVGGDGVIGSALASFLRDGNHSVIATTRRRIHCSPIRPYLDLGDPNTFSNVISHPFRAAVLCGGITSIKTCEAQPQLTRTVNVSGTLQLAKALSMRGIHIIYISTNMVFDGTKPFTCAADPKNPLTEYGRQKSNVEDCLYADIPLSTVIRFGKVLQQSHPLFTTWYNETKGGNTIAAFVDKLFAPISLDLACKVIRWLIINRQSGQFQISAQSDISYYNAALHLVHYYGLDVKLVEPVYCNQHDSSNDQPSINPRSTTLKTSPELRDAFGVPTPLESLIYSFGH